MKAKLPLVLFFLLSSISTAIKVPEMQKEIKLTLQQDEEFSFLLVLINERDESEHVQLTRSEGCDFIKFGGEKKDSYELSLPPHSQVLLPIFVSVGKNLTTRRCELIVNGETLSEIEIAVTFSPSEVRALLQNRDVIASLKLEVKRLEQRISELLANVTNATSSEVSELRKEVSEVKESLKQVAKRQEEIAQASPTAAAIASAQSMAIGFIVGLALALMALYLTKGEKLRGLYRFVKVEKSS